MNPQDQAADVPIYQLIVVRPEPPGKFTAEVVGLPEIRESADSPHEAVKRVRFTLHNWLVEGKLVQIDVPRVNPLLQFCGWAKDSPLQQEYMEELARMKREDLERTLREYDQEDADSSSTPAT